MSTLLFQPPPPSKLKEHKIVWLDTKLGSKIPSFYIAYRRINGVETYKSLSADEIKSSSPHEGITILYSHANAEDLGSIYPWCKFLSKMLHVNLFAYDYTGYGMAFEQGDPSEAHCYADIDAAYEYLRSDLKIPASNIVLYGRSLGSGPSCYLAAKSANEPQREMYDGPVGGVILHAPFLSVYRVVIDTGCTVYGDKFPNIDFAPMIKSPVILIHGKADQIVPFHHSERIYEALSPPCRARPIFIDGMGHNNVHAEVRPVCVERLTDYLSKHVWPRAVVSRGNNYANQSRQVHSQRSMPRTKRDRERHHRERISQAASETDESYGPARLKVR